MSGAEILCFVNILSPGDFSTCMNQGGWLGILGYFSLLLIFIGGWSVGIGISKGFLIGGFFGILLGIIFMIFQWVSMQVVMFSFLITFVGLLLSLPDILAYFESR